MENNIGKVVVAITPQELAAHRVDLKELEPYVNADIVAFDAYFQGLGNDPLVRSEVAIIKTYLHYKLKGEQDGPATGG